MRIKKMLWWMPDKPYLQLYYLAKLKKVLHLKNPKSFNEKLQWLKLYDRKKIYTTMVDKFEAKKYVADRIGESYIIPTLGVWDRVEDIDFSSLPDKFVIKCTHDSGGLIVCRDKSKLDVDKTKRILPKSLRNDFYSEAREWPYKNVKRRIIAEQFMEDENQRNGLIDYKFYCFDGEPKFLYVSKGLEDHATANISFLNLDWSFAPFQRSDYKGFDILPEKPAGYEKMLELARCLSEGTSFLRVDLYEIGGKIYFSELTFTPCGGTMTFSPPEWDDKIGQWLTLPKKTKEEK